MLHAAGSVPLEVLGIIRSSPGGCKLDEPLSPAGKSAVWPKMKNRSRLPGEPMPRTEITPEKRRQ